VSPFFTVWVCGNGSWVAAAAAGAGAGGVAAGSCASAPAAGIATLNTAHHPNTFIRGGKGERLGLQENMRSIGISQRRRCLVRNEGRTGIAPGSRKFNATLEVL
jgi:hypothetical protein